MLSYSANYLFLMALVAVSASNALDVEIEPTAPICDLIAIIASAITSSDFSMRSRRASVGSEFCGIGLLRIDETFFRCFTAVSPCFRLAFAFARTLVVLTRFRSTPSSNASASEMWVVRRFNVGPLKRMNIGNKIIMKMKAVFTM